MTYDASSIKVLKPEEAEESFQWLKAENLSSEYMVPLKCVQRGLETSTILGIKPDYYINKYLKKQDIDIMPEFIEVYKTLMKKF